MVTGRPISRGVETALPISRVAVETGGERYDATYAQTFADVKPGELIVYQDAYRTLALAVNRGDAAGTLEIGVDAEVRLQPG